MPQFCPWPAPVVAARPHRRAVLFGATGGPTCRSGKFRLEANLLSTIVDNARRPVDDGPQASSHPVLANEPIYVGAIQPGCLRRGRNIPVVPLEQPAHVL